MLNSIRLRCPECDHVYHQSVAYVTGQIKAMKIEKRDQAAQQMADKRGPFYDKWLKAMKARGEQKRCLDCKDYFYEPGDSGCTSLTSGVNQCTGGRFACKHIRPLEEPD